MFFWRGLTQLVLYDGQSPWTNGKLSTYEQEWRYGALSVTHKPSEHWAAYVRASDQWGVGAHFPASSILLAYQYGPPERANEPWTCSYLAPISMAQLTPNAVISYNAYITAGSLAQIRAAFYKVHANPAAY